MSRIQRIVVHCTAEPANAVRDRDYYEHLFFEVYKWKHWGYHVIVYQDGTWEILQPLPKEQPWGGTIDESTRANGAQGYNFNSLHIAYVGGLATESYIPRDTRTEKQRETLRFLIAKWKHQYKVKEVVGHNQLPGVKKACPCFDARKEYENV